MMQFRIKGPMSWCWEVRPSTRTRFQIFTTLDINEAHLYYEYLTTVHHQYRVDYYSVQEFVS